VGDLDKGTVAPIAVPAPEAGMLRNISALPGQTVPSGAALFEVFDPTRVWVRLGVYVGDLPGLATGADVRVGNLAEAVGGATRPAHLVKDAPPAANALAATVDLFYKLENSDGQFRPGQRVAVHIPLKGEKVSLVVPRGAVVYDYLGGTWLYENTAPRVYVRRRVRLRYVHGDDAILDAGPPAGTKVVSVGAAELFGTEVGFAK
jgi:hypothetical protein